MSKKVNNDVAQMAETLAALEAQAAALEERQRVLHDEERGCALDAHSGDAAARDRLSRTYGDLGGVADELRSIGIAIAEAKKRLAAAQEAQRIAAEAAKARQVEAMLPGIEADFELIGAAAIQLREAVEAAIEKVKTLNRLGVPLNQRLEEIQIQRVLDGLWMGSALQQRHLAPRERRTIDAVTRDVVNRSREFVSARVETKRKAAA